MSSTRENPIDLTGSDDDNECDKKRKEPTEEVTEKKVKRVKEVKKCYRCEVEDDDLRSTGNSLGFICYDCMEDIPEMSFCDRCDRYEETDGENLCGRCQYEIEKEYELKRQCERAFARRIGAVPDINSSDDDEESEVDSD